MPPTTGRHRPRVTIRRSIRPYFPERTIPGAQCLNLNVWTPSEAIGQAKLPVLVWIHGGSFFGDLLAAVVTDRFFMVPAVRHAEARAATN